jgi:uncharacterized membrane protein (UPF0127 family)
MKPSLAFHCLSLLSVAIVAACGAPSSPQFQQAADAGAAIALPSGRIIRAEIADDPASREKGLMFRKSLPRGRGMLFVFPGETTLDFWMKNTLVPLDIVFLDAKGAVTHIAAGLEPPGPDVPDWAIPRASGYGQYVLEIPAGEAAADGLGVGSRLQFKVAIPRT